MGLIDLRQRAPKNDILPDLRQRVTRSYDVIRSLPQNPTTIGTQLGLSEIILPWGTADDSYEDCLLVGQSLSGDYEENGNTPSDKPKPLDKPPIWTRASLSRFRPPGRPASAIRKSISDRMV